MTYINEEKRLSWLSELQVSRENKKENTIIDIYAPDGSLASCFGNGYFSFIAGPCTIESASQVFEVAEAVTKSGAQLFRAGAFKSRTSPYDFPGMREAGLELLRELKAKYNVPVVSEILSAAHLPLFEDVDIIQVGERNMRNAELLSELSHINKPILLKRNHSATIREFLLSAEYLVSGGNKQVILCERGIRSFETLTRNTMDISAIPLLKELTHLPVIADPSHATGLPSLVQPMSLAATVVGADGLMIEVHSSPCDALCDGSQAILPSAFADLVSAVKNLKANI